ncbi:MAG: flavodoxin domain-containing protein [Candidatus Omnitrophica bacterium]|nr:flavodoxin domain-containing protein [Candidatus Omnitrophota bacterium]
MAVLEILPGIYSVGVVDWNVRNFHGHTYTTKRGTTYNAYLIIDEKVTLIDTVYGPFAAELMENIRQVIPVEKVDYIIANHVETDHSGALPEIMKLVPKAKIFGTKNCQEGLYRYYYGDWDFGIVKTGDKLKLGKRSLTFIEAPMVHWPDSMFTYCPEEELLMPNDAFGQHLATNERFADQVDPCALWDEAAKYYSNILWPLGAVILKKIEEVLKLNIPIKIIAPSHGVIWRKDPIQIINKYVSWAKNETLAKVVLVYESMWGATEKMARKIIEGVQKEGLSVKLFDITGSDRTEVVKEMLEAKGFIFGSSTHDNGILTTLAGFLEFIKGFKPKNRLAASFGSYGWAGGAVKQIEDIAKEAGLELAATGLQVKYMPDKDDLEKCFEFGRNFALKIKGK